MTPVEQARLALVDCVRRYMPMPAVVSAAGLAALNTAMDNLQAAAVSSVMAGTPLTPEEQAAREKDAELIRAETGSTPAPVETANAIGTSAPLFETETAADVPQEHEAPIETPREEVETPAGEPNNQVEAAPPGN